MEGQAYSRRLNDLEQRFVALAEQMPDSPDKEAISVLHGMLQEIWRTFARGAAPSTSGMRGGSMTFEDIANLYKSAPGMPGSAQNQPLPVGAAAPDFTLRDANGEDVSLRDFPAAPSCWSSTRSTGAPPAPTS